MKTIRIQNIPACATRQDILNFFDGLDPIEESLTLATFGITAKKLATLAFPTVQLAKDAARKNLTKLVPEADNQKATIVEIDARFFGATPLTNGSEDLSKAIDIFIIQSPGLHGLEAWSHRHADGTETNWPRDLLPLDFPHARVILVGLKGVPFRKNRALWLQDSMEEVKAAITDPRLGSKARPAMYIAHCFSGVYLQAALISTMPELARVQDWAIGTVFFATPNPGTRESTSSTSSAPESKDAPKTLARTIQSSSILQTVSREFIQRVNERYYHVLSIVEGEPISVGPGGPVKLTDRETSVFNLDPGHETVLFSERNLVEMCRYESRDSLRYIQLVRGLKKIERKAPVRVMGTWGIIRKWIQSQSPESARVDIPYWEDAFDDYDSFSASIGLIPEEGIRFIVDSPATYLVFKGDPATGIDEYPRRVAISMLKDSESAVYIHGLENSSTAADFWKAILGQISSWNNQWIRNHVTDVYYKFLAGQWELSQETALFPIGLMAGGGFLKYIFVEGLDTNPNRHAIMKDLAQLVRVSGGKLKVILSVCDDSGLELEAANIENFTLVTEDICQAHFQRYASRLLDKLHEKRDQDLSFGPNRQPQVSTKDFENIHELYRHIFNTLIMRWGMDGDEKVVEKVRKVLKLVLFSYRPLHIEELLGAIDLAKRETTRGKLEVQLSEFRIFVEENLGPFLEFDIRGPGMVTLESQRFRTFMSRADDLMIWLMLDTQNVPEDSETFEKQCHAEILAMCLSSIHETERRRHLQRSQPDLFAKSHGLRIQGVTLSSCGFYNYAMQYWLDHLKKSRDVVAETPEPPIGYLLAMIASARFREAAKAIAATSSITRKHTSGQHKQTFSHLGIHALNDAHGREYYKLAQEQVNFLKLIKKTKATFKAEIFLRKESLAEDYPEGPIKPDAYTFDLDTVQMEDEPLPGIIIKYASYGFAFIRRRFNSTDSHGLTYAEMIGELPSHPPKRSSLWKAMDSLKRRRVGSANYNHLGDLDRRIEFLKVADSLRNITLLLQTTGLSTAKPQFSDYNGYPIINLLSETSQMLNVLASFDLPTKIEDFDLAAGLNTQYLTLFRTETSPQIYKTTTSLFSANTPRSGKHNIQIGNADRILMSSIRNVSFVDQFRAMCTVTFILQLFTWSAIKYSGPIYYPLLLVTLTALVKYAGLFESQLRVAKFYASYVSMKVFPPTNGSSTQEAPKLSEWEAPHPRNFCKALLTLCLYRLASLFLLGVMPFPSTFLKALIDVTLWSTLGFGNAILEPFLGCLAVFLVADHEAPAMAKWKRNLFWIWIPIDVGRFLLDIIPSLLGKAQKDFLVCHIPMPVLNFLLSPPLDTYNFVISLITPLILYVFIFQFYGRIEFNILRTCIFSINTVTNILHVVSFTVDWLVETSYIGYIWAWFVFYSIWSVYHFFLMALVEENEWDYWAIQAELSNEFMQILWDAQIREDLHGE